MSHDQRHSKQANKQTNKQAGNPVKWDALLQTENRIDNHPGGHTNVASKREELRPTSFEASP